AGEAALGCRKRPRHPSAGRGDGNNLTRVPRAVHRVAVHRGCGTAKHSGGPGSAMHHFVLHCARDTRTGEPMPDIKTVGFIGIGNMGRPMSANLVRGGYTVTLYDLDGKRARQAAVEIGAKSAATLAELGKEADAIITMLPTGREVRACLF